MQIENWTIECVAEQCAWQQLTSKSSGPEPFLGDQVRVCMLTHTYCTYTNPWGRLKWPSAITRSEEDCPFYLKPYVLIGDLQTCKMSMVMYMTLNVVSEISHHHETTQNASFKSKVK